MTSSTQTLAEFIESNGLTMKTVTADRNPSMADDTWGREASHYFCTIYRPDGESVSLHFSMGAAHTEPPTLEQVLDALASDVASVINSPDWLDWAEELGYEGAEQLRRARASHRAIERQHEELQRLLGTDALDVLLWNTERL